MDVIVNALSSCSAPTVQRRRMLFVAATIGNRARLTQREPHDETTMSEPIDSPDASALRIALIGYGEVGGIFGAALAERGVGAISAWDILLADSASSAGMRAKAARGRVALARDAQAAVAGADLVISAVTASATGDAAASVVPTLKTGAFLLDVNSASPGTKSGCGAIIAAAGGRYVEAAVMTSVPPLGIRVPMLLGGPHARAAVPVLAALGFAVTPVSDEYGVASAIKMCRSVIVKGMEAIVIESFLTARRYGVEREVLASLAETFPGIDWEQQGSWFWKRVVQHGRRRVEEMREAAVTVREAGIEPTMAMAIADRQAWVAALAADGAFRAAAGDAGWRDLADCVSGGIAPDPKLGR
jgi:3-hydroxyisobutyrate dehydrogenase-like beta-hydroxyacid dehydrogenase